jgi:hypothetical protein
LRDLVRAKILLDNYGNAPVPSALIGSLYDMLAFLSENPQSAQWLYDVLPREAAAVIEASNWFNADNRRDSSFTAGSGARQLTLAGLNFINFSTDNSLISETPVPRSLFEIFLNENPRWREHLTDYFPQEIAVNPMNTYRAEAVTGITWYAAEAFCKWLTAFLPPAMAGMEVRLPSETEWEYAAQIISNMTNPGWEWCAEPYVPLPFITASSEAINAVGSPERLLRGRPFYASEETRASLPAHLSSPFVTFRPVISMIHR